jgi:preprotein translocase subunit SecA
VSIEKSERVSSMLKKKGTKHIVLNAKYHAQEAEIVAQAGRKGAVTIATNMAGRGTDILLGGNPEFMARQQCLADQVAERLPKGQERFVDDEEFVYFFHLDAFYRVPRKDYERIFSGFQAQTSAEHEDVVGLGGLHIVGTERHEARRIDNQLRGRAGRQGDPGSSRFYLSLEDDLMRIFGTSRVSGLMEKLGMEEGVPIEHSWVTKAIEGAQKRVEANNFSTRKHLLEYDDVMNKQRENVYALRRELLEGKIRVGEEQDDAVESRGYLMAIAEEIVEELVDTHAGKDQDEPDFGALANAVSELFGIEAGSVEALKLDETPPADRAGKIFELAQTQYDEKERSLGIDPAILRRIERDIMLQIVDAQWKDHLYSLDHLKEGIGLRGYGQRDPLVEYKKESFALFQAMKGRIDEEMVRYLWRVRPVLSSEGAAPVAPVRQPVRKPPTMTFSAGSSTTAPRPRTGPPMPSRTGGDDAPITPVRRDEPKIGRNDPCFCGSGKKYKKCHGA